MKVLSKSTLLVVLAGCFGQVALGGFQIINATDAELYIIGYSTCTNETRTIPPRGRDGMGTLAGEFFGCRFYKFEGTLTFPGVEKKKTLQLIRPPEAPGYPRVIVVREINDKYRIQDSDAWQWDARPKSEQKRESLFSTLLGE